MAGKPTYEKLEQRVKELENAALERRRSEAWLPRLNQLKEELLRPAGIIEKLNRITNGVVEIFDADFCRIWITRPGDTCYSGCFHATVTEGPHVCHYRDRCLHLVASSGRYTHTDGGHGRVPFGCYKIGRVASGEDAKFITNDVTHDPRVHDHEWARTLGLVSFAGYRLLSADGTTIGVLALFSKHAILANEGALLEGVANSTAQVIQTAITEETLRENEEKFRQLAEHVEVVFWISSPDWKKVIYVSPAYEKIWGRSCESLYQQPGSWLNAVLEEDRERVVADVKKKTAGDLSEPKFPEYRVVRPDGSVRWILARAFPVWNERGEVYRVAGIAEDITERKRTDEALRESERKYSSLVENSLTGIYIDQDGKIVFANKRFAEIYGYSADALQGMESWRLVHPEDRSMTDEIRNKRMRGEEAPSEYEARGVTKDGETIWIHRRNTRIEYGGKPAILGNIVDFTESKRLEVQFQQAQKMEAIGTLAGGIAHDFNNLLMAIQGRTSLMLMNTGSDHLHFAHLTGIEEMVERGADLSKQLLGFARGGKYEVRTTDLNDLIGKSSEMFGRTKKEIRIHREFQKDLWPVEVDRGQMEQVLLNLYVNAWQAMPDGGDLYLETKNVTLDQEYAKSFGVEPGNYGKVSITDTGAGMDQATRQRVFEPFFTTREMGGGSGLGLASAYGIIKNHGGVINLYSEPGHGTTFAIYLPASDKEVAKEEEPSAEVLKGTEAVLLVDDEDMVLEVGKEMLTTLGYKVVLARSGKQAIELYKDNHDKTDMVILDMIMPDIGGREVYDRLKVINPKVKVLLSSGYSMDGQADEILQRGCDGFIQKPFNVQRLSSKLREILDGQ